MNDLISGMKKLVAITVAGAAALLVATWRKAGRETSDFDHGIAPEPAAPPSQSPPEPAAPAAGSSPVAGSSRAAEPSPSEPDRTSVSESSSKAELYEVAQDLQIKGRSKMNKDELLRAIRAAR